MRWVNASHRTCQTRQSTTRMSATLTIPSIPDGASVGVQQLAEAEDDQEQHRR